MVECCVKTKCKEVVVLLLYLESHDVLHFGGFSITDAGMEEAGSNADTQGFASHSSVSFLAVRRYDAKRSEKEYQQALRVNGQRCYDSERKHFIGITGQK